MATGCLEIRAAAFFLEQIHVDLEISITGITKFHISLIFPSIFTFINFNQMFINFLFSSIFINFLSSMFINFHHTFIQFYQFSFIFINFIINFSMNVHHFSSNVHPF